MTGESTEVLRAEGPWEHRSIHARGMKFHAVVAGDQPERPAVILLPDFPLHWWSWRKQVERLATAGYKVIALDLRGMGGTDFQPGSVDLDELAEDVLAVARATGTPEFTVVGSGVGGAVAWLLAHQGPTGLQSVTTVCAPHPLTRRGRSAHRAVAADRVDRELGVPVSRAKRLQDGSLVTSVLTTWCAPSSVEHMRTVAPAYARELKRKVAADAALETQRAARRPSGRSKKTMDQQVKVPVWSIYGGSDGRISTDVYGKDSRHAKAPVTHVELPAAGHFPTEEAPEDLTQALLQHLETVYG